MNIFWYLTLAALPAEHIRQRAFSVTGPTLSNTLMDRLHDPTLKFRQFSKKLLKTKLYLRVVKHTNSSRDASQFCAKLIHN